MHKRYPILFNEFTIFSRNKLQFAGVIAFLLLGVYSIYYGKTEIAKEQKKIQVLADSIRTVQTNYAAALHTDTGIAGGKYKYEIAALPSLVRFNYNFLVADIPSHLAALSLGQREMYPSYYILNAQSLYVQTLKGEINNPFKLSAGNFDLAFVLVFLLPLLVIALGFDMLSAEQESGVVPFLRVSDLSLRRILFIKTAFRFILTTVIILVLFLTGVLAAGTTLFTTTSFLWLAVALLYNTLWHGIILLVNSFNRSSAFNAIVALGTWVLLLLVIPSTLNVAVKNRGMNALDLSALMRSRNMASTTVAMNKALDEFYIHYPDLRSNVDTTSKFFFHQGYSAFLYNTDQASARLVDSFTNSVQDRIDRVQHFIPVNPAVNTLELFNDISGTGLKSKLAFKKAVTAFHKKIFWFSNSVLFANRYMTADDYQQAPVCMYIYTPDLSEMIVKRLIWIVLLAGLCYLLAYINLGENKLYK